MKGLSRIVAGVSVAVVALIFSASQARAVINVDGTLGGDYGSALAVQGNPTGFGNSTSGDGLSTGGSELDAGYGVISGGSLYLFLAGNVEINTGSSGNANHWNVFIATGAPGQSTLNISPSTAGNMNGSTFSPGFQGVYMVDANNFGGTLFVDGVDLTTGPPATSSFLPASAGASHRRQPRPRQTPRRSRRRPPNRRRPRARAPRPSHRKRLLPIPVASSAPPPADPRCRSAEASVRPVGCRHGRRSSNTSPRARRRPRAVTFCAPSRSRPASVLPSRR